MAAAEQRSGQARSSSAKAGASQSSPIAASRLRIARRSQTCTAGPDHSRHDQREPSGLKVGRFTSHDSGLSSRAIIAARLGLDQTDDLVASRRNQPAVGESKSPAADLPAFVPGADRPEPAWCVRVNSHFPSGLKPTPHRPSIAQIGAPPRTSDAPNLRHRSCMHRLPAIAVRADGDVAAVVQRPHLELSSGVRTWVAPQLARAMIRPAGLRQIPVRSRERELRGGPMRNSPLSMSSRTGHRRTPLRPAGEQVAGRLKHDLPWRFRSRRKPTRPRARSQSTTPRPHPRPVAGCRGESRHDEVDLV